MAWQQHLRRLIKFMAPALGAAMAIGILGAALALAKPAGSSDPAPGSRSSQVPGAEVDRITGVDVCHPLLVAVGASYTEGVGAPRRLDAWPYQLARLLDWRVMAYGVPGAGYIRPGWDGQGPLWREVGRLDLRHLHPSLVIIQSGHNDIGEPLPLLRQRVRQLIARVRAETPRSALAVLTVFIRADHRPSAHAWATDRTIVSAARQVDPRVLVFDPLAGHWHYPRPAGHLHPRIAGYRWIAEHLADVLRHDGITAQPSGCTSAS